MTRSVYIASPEGESGKSTVALGLVDLLTRQVGRVGVFRPLTESLDRIDLVVELLLAHPAVEQRYEDAIGLSYDHMHADPEHTLGEIVRRFREIAARFDVVVVLGSDYTDVSTPNELAFNARVAANLGAPVVLVVRGVGRSPAQIRTTVDVARTELAVAHAHPVAVIANRVDPEDLGAVRDALRPGSSWAGFGHPRGAHAVRAGGPPVDGGLRRAAAARQSRMVGETVARLRGRCDVAAERPDQTAPRHHGDRAG